MHAERRLLHAVFGQLPVPVFLLGQDRTIRRTNTAAAELLGSAPGYATGKQFAALVDVPDRARVQTQIANALRTGKPRRLRCRLLSADGGGGCRTDHVRGRAARGRRPADRGRHRWRSCCRTARLRAGGGPAGG